MVKLNWNELAQQPPGPFKPEPHYDADSDTLSLFIRDDESYRERVDTLLTIYRSIATRDVVGCHIKHVHRILKTVNAFNLGVTAGGITIGMILLGLPLVEGQEPVVRGTHYLEVVEPITREAGHRVVSIPAIA